MFVVPSQPKLFDFAQTIASKQDLQITNCLRKCNEAMI